MRYQIKLVMFGFYQFLLKGKNYLFQLNFPFSSGTISRKHKLKLNLNMKAYKGEAALVKEIPDEVRIPLGPSHCHRSPMLWRAVCLVFVLFCFPKTNKQTKRQKTLSFCNVLLPDTATDPSTKQTFIILSQGKMRLRNSLCTKEGYFFYFFKTPYSNLGSTRPTIRFC